MKIFIILFLSMFCGIAFAEEVAKLVQEPEQITDALKLIPVIMGALKDGNFLLAGAAISLVSTFLFRKYAMAKVKMGPGILPIVSAIVGCMSGVSLAIYGGATVSQASLAVLSGPLASTLWDSLLKYFFKK